MSWLRVLFGAAEPAPARAAALAQTDAQRARPDDFSQRLLDAPPDGDARSECEPGVAAGVAGRTTGTPAADGELDASADAARVAEASASRTRTHNRPVPRPAPPRRVVRPALLPLICGPTAALSADLSDSFINAVGENEVDLADDIEAFPPRSCRAEALLADDDDAFDDNQPDDTEPP